jgi:hypothetical protein
VCRQTDHKRFLLTAFTAARAAARDTVPVFAEFLIVRLFDGASLDEALATADLDTLDAVFSPASFELATADLPVG